jgi:AcrR family transcriptional regulator
MLFNHVSQKATFTREMILAAAFALTREQGWASVTARNIARKLHSSTMPLYSSLKSMEAIAGEVRTRAEACMQGYQRRSYSENRMLDAAIGYVVFARDEKHLFRFLYVDQPLPAVRSPQEGMTRGLAKDAVALGGVVDLADQAATAMRDPRVLKSWAFSHGLASLIGSGVIDLPDDRIAALLSEMGAAIYGQEGGTT